MARSQTPRKGSTLKRTASASKAGHDASYSPPSTPSSADSFNGKPRVYKPPIDPSYRPSRQPNSPSSSDSSQTATKGQNKKPISKVSKTNLRKSGKAATRCEKNVHFNENVMYSDAIPEGARSHLNMSDELRKARESFTRAQEERKIRQQKQAAFQPLTPPSSPFNSLKRKFEEPTFEFSPSKKARFDNPSPQASNFFPSSPTSPGKALGDFSTPLPSHPVEKLLDDIVTHPAPLELSEVSALFYSLQERMQAFVSRYFSFTLSEEEQAVWPLHELSSKYLPLMLTTQYIADGSQYGWRQFLTTPEHRVPLVYGILGEWFRHRIFNHTAFGLTEGELDELEDVDREYLHYDAFVRNKARANVLRRILYEKADGSLRSSTDRDGSLYIVARSLASDLTTLLTPLLPPPIFTTCPKSGQFSRSTNPSAEAIFSTLTKDLTYLVKSAAGLHQSIRLTGVNGTTIRLVPHVPKGYPFRPMAAMNCINQDFCNGVRDGHIHLSNSTPTSREEQDKQRDEMTLQIKMTCFPRVEAYVPHGPDRFELEEKQCSIITEDLDGDEDAFDWRDYEDDIWPELPQELQMYLENESRRNRPRRRSSTTLTSPSSTEAVDGSDADDNNEDNSYQDVEPHNSKRQAYVSWYKVLCTSDVYCEWTPPSTSSATNKPTRLRDAVTAARTTHLSTLHLPARLTSHLSDRSVLLWNTFVRHEPLLEIITLGLLGGWGSMRLGRAVLGTQVVRQLVRILGVKGAQVVMVLRRVIEELVSTRALR